MAPEMFPEGFSNGQRHIPESGNGIPGVLNEALWTVPFCEEYQHPSGPADANPANSPGAKGWRHRRGQRSIQPK